jgi:hypothetical protein
MSGSKKKSKPFFRCCLTGQSFRQALPSEISLKLAPAFSESERGAKPFQSPFITEFGMLIYLS